jgi:uncharacterized membrane protein
MKRTVFLYLATLLVMVPLDVLFLGILARGFFQSQVGDMLGPLRPVPAVVFYLVYAAGILVFVSATGSATIRSALIYGALFGLFAYATFDLTVLAVLRHWTWPVAFVDVAWGSFVTAVSAAAGLAIANALTRAS